MDNWDAAESIVGIPYWYYHKERIERKECVADKGSNASLALMTMLFI